MPPLHRPLHYMLRLRWGRPSLLWRSSWFREQSLLEKAGMEGHREPRLLWCFPKQGREEFCKGEGGQEQSSLSWGRTFVFSTSLGQTRTYCKITHRHLGWGGEEEWLSSTTVRSKQGGCRFVKRDTLGLVRPSLAPDVNPISTTGC